MLIFSGIQPSGTLTLGNYLGAMKQFKNFSPEDEQLYAIVDLHSLTTVENAETLRENTKSIASWYIALGLHEHATLYRQSDVYEHTELMWILENFATVGELGRMTQYKSKSEGKDSAKSSLFTYPVLMASDILLYQTTHVPVGEDQKQHLELTRDIAQKFNSKYGEFFTVPEPLIKKEGAKIMSLTDPTKKMSKSDENLKSKILLTDSEKDIKKKIKSATTDSIGVINYDVEKQPGISNLLTIYAASKGITIAQAVEYFEGKNYGTLKEEVAQAVVDEIMPVQKRYYEIMDNPEYIEGILQLGKEEAHAKASENLSKVKEKVGLR